MKVSVLIVAGAVVALAGVVFTLQGLKVMGGGAMSGQPIWVVLGPVIAVVGLAVVTAGARRGRMARR